MSTVAKFYQYTSSAEGWVAGGDTADTILEWSASGGQTNAGCLSSRINGRKKSADTDWSYTGTWESLGVPAGGTVTGIQLNGMAWRCPVWVVGETITPSEVRSFLLNQSDAVTLIVSMSNNQGGILGTTSYATVSGVNMAVPGAFQPSTTTINIMADVYLRTANNAAAAVTILLDDINFTITYTDPALGQQILIVNFG